VKRREFIAALGGAVAWPVPVHAQQAALPVLGCLINGSSSGSEWFVLPFRQGLGDAGYVEGLNLVIEYRWADGHNERLRALADELVALRVNVIAALPGASTALAAKRSTSAIPIVFLTAGDAVELGIVAALNRPEGNLTGVSGVINLLVTKQLGLLGELVPKPVSFALFTNPSSPNTKALVESMKAAALAGGRELHILSTGDERELDAAFAMLKHHHAGGLIVPASSFYSAQRERMVALAAAHRIPAIYDGRAFVEAGGLISYGINVPAVYRQLGVYTGKILRGAKPADLPVFQPSKFELVINLKTAKSLGLEVPLSMQLLADEVIE
jgi:putative tryptophan/tyrosine transport system substrate-binding protein